MSSAVPPAKYADRSRQLDMDMLVYRVPDHLRRVIVAVRLLSWDKHRDAAPVEEMLVLAKALHMDAGDCSRAIKEAKKMKLLRVERLAGSWWLELLPNTAVWIDRSTTKVAVRIDESTTTWKRESKKKSKCAPTREEVAEALKAWRLLDAEGDPAQVKLPMEVAQSHPPLGDDGFGDALAETNREEADLQRELGNSQSVRPPTRGGTGELGNSQSEGQNPKRYDLGNSQFTHAGAGARKHEHEHVPTSVPQSMVPCYHGRSVAEEEAEDRFAGLHAGDLVPMLDDESKYWYSQLPEIFGDEEFDKFELTWLKRLCDRWANCAWRAIGLVKEMKMKGRPFNKGPGHTANFYFNQYRYAAWKAAREKAVKAGENEHAN